MEQSGVGHNCKHDLGRLWFNLPRLASLRFERATDRGVHLWRRASQQGLAARLSFNLRQEYNSSHILRQPATYRVLIRRMRGGDDKRERHE